MKIRRRDLVLVEFDPVKGSEQRGTRPAVVIQNDVGNRNSSTTIVAPLTSSYNKIYPVNVEVKSAESDLKQDSIVMLDQIATIDKEARAIRKLGEISSDKMKEIDEALRISLDI